MADENPVNTEAATPETVVETPEEKPKARIRRKPAPVAEVKEDTVAGKASAGKRKRYSDAERGRILTSIAKSLEEDKTTLKTALKAAGVSEQTYYNWKRDADKQAAPASGDGLADLVKLEAENQRLRKELAEKLRAENAELRKRLARL